MEKRFQSRRKRRTNACQHKAKIQAFGSNYELCLFLKDFADEPIVGSSWSSLRITVFGLSNTSTEVPVSSMDLKYASGYVVGENFTTVSGFLMDDHFYGTIYMPDRVHYLEPHDRQSRDMKIFGDGLKTLLHE